MCLSCWLDVSIHGSLSQWFRLVEETCVHYILQASLLLLVVGIRWPWSSLVVRQSFLTVRSSGTNFEMHQEPVQLLPSLCQPCLNWQSAPWPRYSCFEHCYRDALACLCVSASFPPNFDDLEVPMPFVACSAWLSRSQHSTLSYTYWASSYLRGSVQAPGSFVPRWALSSIAATMVLGLPSTSSRATEWMYTHSTPCFPCLGPISWLFQVIIDVSYAAIRSSSRQVLAEFP